MPVLLLCISISTLQILSCEMLGAFQGESKHLAEANLNLYFLYKSSPSIRKHPPPLARRAIVKNGLVQQKQ